jgi:hypothetical protein
MDWLVCSDDDVAGLASGARTGKVVVEVPAVVSVHE